jgi:hypothetical protein
MHEPTLFVLYSFIFSCARHSTRPDSRLFFPSSATADVAAAAADAAAAAAAVQRYADPDLSPLGTRQALLLGEHIKTGAEPVAEHLRHCAELGSDRFAIFSSPMRRTLKTTWGLAREFQCFLVCLVVWFVTMRNSE